MENTPSEDPRDSYRGDNPPLDMNEQMFEDSTMRDKVMFWMESISPGTGHYGIDITLQDGSLPCKAFPTPEYKHICVEPYFVTPRFPDEREKYQEYKLGDTGLKIRNFTRYPHPDNGPKHVQHNFARELKRVDVEIYAYETTTDDRGHVAPKYLDLRKDASSFNRREHGWHWSNHIGHVKLPEVDYHSPIPSDPKLWLGNWARLQGEVWLDKGAKIRATSSNTKKIKVKCWGKKGAVWTFNDQGEKETLMHGYKVAEFTGSGVGFYQTYAVPKGAYKVRVNWWGHDGSERYRDYNPIALRFPHERVDLDISSFKPADSMEPMDSTPETGAVIPVPDSQFELPELYYPERKLILP